jgi:peptide deformylase
MIRDILTYGAPQLEKNCAPVERFDEDLRMIVQDMFETMYAAPGIGLAAPQIGLDMRLIVIDLTGGQSAGKQIVMANPEIVEESGTQKEEEGCLSIPGLTAVVERPMLVKVKGRDLEGKEIEMQGEGLLARAFCHEIDHINGVLYLNRLSPWKRDSLRRKIRKLVKAGEW